MKEIVDAETLAIEYCKRTDNLPWVLQIAIALRASTIVSNSLEPNLDKKMSGKDCMEFAEFLIQDYIEAYIDRNQL